MQVHEAAPGRKEIRAMQLIGTVGLASLFAGSPSKRNGSASLPTCLAEREIVHLRDGWRSIEKLPRT
jgi:hypothetical protein